MLPGQFYYLVRRSANCDHQFVNSLMWAFKYLGEVFVRQNKRSRHVEALISFLPFNTNRFTSTSVMHANIHRANMRGKVGGVYIQTFAVIPMAKTRIYFFENHKMPNLGSLPPERSCNGQGEAAYVAAAIIDLRSGNIICEGLLKPHSPRLQGGVSFRV